MTVAKGRLTRRGGGAIVHFDHAQIPDVIRFAGADWRAKREFHVTLFTAKTIRALTSSEDDVIKRAARRLTFGVTLRDEVWQVREGVMRSIIRMCDVDGAEELFTRLEAELHTTIERPPYHVTLYTIGTLRGIGLHTHEDLQRCGERIEGLEREALRSAIQ